MPRTQRLLMCQLRKSTHSVLILKVMSGTLERSNRLESRTGRRSTNSIPRNCKLPIKKSWITYSMHIGSLLLGLITTWLSHRDKDMSSNLVIQLQINSLTVLKELPKKVSRTKRIRTMMTKATVMNLPLPSRTKDWITWTSPRLTSKGYFSRMIRRKTSQPTFAVSVQITRLRYSS